MQPQSSEVSTKEAQSLWVDIECRDGLMFCPRHNDRNRRATLLRGLSKRTRQRGAASCIFIFSTRASFSSAGPPHCGPHVPGRLNVVIFHAEKAQRVREPGLYVRRLYLLYARLFCVAASARTVVDKAWPGKWTTAAVVCHVFILHSFSQLSRAQGFYRPRY